MPLTNEQLSEFFNLADYLARSHQQIDAEPKLLGMIMGFPETFLVAAQEIEAGWFSVPMYKGAFALMEDLYYPPRNILPTGAAMIDEMRRQGQLEGAFGGEQTIKLMVKEALSLEGAYADPAAVVSSLAKLVRDGHQRDKLKEISLTLLRELAWQNMPLDKLLEKVQGDLQSVNELTVTPAKSYDDVRAEVLEEQRAIRAGVKPRAGLSTGLYQLDDVIGPMLPAQLITIGGSTRDGKSSLALSIAYSVAVQARQPVAYLSLEMPEEVLYKRHQLMATNIGSHSLLTMQELNNPETISTQRWAQFEEDIKILEDKLFEPRFCPSLQVGHVEGMLRDVSKKLGGLSLAVVDWIGRMDEPGYKDNRVAAVNYITRNLHRIAGEMKIPIIILAQLNREVDKAADKHPRLGHLSEASSIAWNSESVILIERPKPIPGELPMMLLHVEKNRNGPEETIEARFYPEAMRVRCGPRR